MLLVLVGLLGLSLSVVAIITNPLQHGVIGKYYDHSEWAEPPMAMFREQRIDLYRKEVEFPALLTYYSIQWSGVLYVPVTGEYQFGLIADDRAEIRLQDRPIVSRLQQEDAQEQERSVMLEKGFYPLNIWYRHEENTEAFGMYWQRPGHKHEPLPYEFLFLEEPTAFEFFIGRGLDMFLLLGKLMAGIACSGGIMLLFIHRRKMWIALANHGLIIASVFVFIFSTHFWGSQTSTSSDSMWTITTALSIIREKNIDLDEYIHLIREQQFYAIENVGRHQYPVSPVGTPLLSVPFVYALDRFLERGLAMDLGKALRYDYGIRGGLEVWIASMFVAFSAIGVYAVSYVRTKDVKHSLLLVGIFAFCTSAWSTASRALWQHTSSIVLLTLVLLAFVWAKEHPASTPLMIRLASVLLAFSFVVRPTNSVSILVFTIYVFMHYRKQFLAYCLWSLFVAIPFFVFNWRVYHSLLSSYYLPQRIGSNPHFLEALAANLCSPARGLFVFSPVFLFSVYGMALKFHQKRITGFDYSLLIILVLHWLTISSFPHWWGGHSFGPRFFSDMLPYLLYFLIPALNHIETLRGMKKTGMIGLFCLTIAISGWIHYRGATDWAVHAWNSQPMNVDEHPERVWGWRDIQFLRGL